MNFYKQLRVWILLSWCFLTIGILLGSWWAYHELGWGGWWFWDPVENASLMPWLVATAGIHSIIQKKIRSWAFFCIQLTFILSILGTFFVRSGLLSSVHSFAMDSTRGLYLLIFLFFIILIPIQHWIHVTFSSKVLLQGFLNNVLKKRILKKPLENTLIKNNEIVQKSKVVLKMTPIKKLFEQFFILQNFYFCAICGVIFCGTASPCLFQWLWNREIITGATFYNSTCIPLFTSIFVAFILVHYLPLSFAPLSSLSMELRKRSITNLFFVVYFIFHTLIGILVFDFNLLNSIYASMCFLFFCCLILGQYENVSFISFLNVPFCSLPNRLLAKIPYSIKNSQKNQLFEKESKNDCKQYPANATKSSLHPTVKARRQKVDRLPAFSVICRWIDLFSSPKSTKHELDFVKTELRPLREIFAPRKFWQPVKDNQPKFSEINSWQLRTSNDQRRGSTLKGKAQQTILFECNTRFTKIRMIPSVDFFLTGNHFCPNMNLNQSTPLSFFSIFNFSKKEMNIAHTGVVFFLLGILLSSTYKLEDTKQLNPGSSVIRLGSQICCLRSIDHSFAPTSHSICANLLISEEKEFLPILRTFYDFNIQNMKLFTKLDVHILDLKSTSNGKILSGMNIHESPTWHTTASSFLHKKSQFHDLGEEYFTPVVCMFPEKRFYYSSSSVVATKVSIYSNLFTDFYSIIGTGSVEAGWFTTIMKLPFIFCIWLGFTLAAGGGILSFSKLFQKSKLHWY